MNPSTRSQAQVDRSTCVGAPAPMPRLVVLVSDLDRLASDLHSQASMLEAGIERVGGVYGDISPCKQVGTAAEVARPQHITARLDSLHEELLQLRGRLENAVKRLQTLA